MPELRIQFAKIIVTCSVLALQPGVPVSAQESADSAARAAYDHALASGLYGEAEVAAKLRLDAAIRAGLRETIATARLFTDLADAQRLNRDHDAAVQNYELAVAIIEGKSDNLDINLAEPLLGIGYAYLDSDRPDLALPKLERSLHVRQVNEGLHNLDQAEILDVLIDAYRAMGESNDAIAAADRLVLLYGRNFSDRSMEVVPALLRKGQVYGEAKNWREERNAYDEAIRVVEHNEGKRSSGLSRPLISFGQSHQREYFDLFLAATAEEELPDKRLLSEAETHLADALEFAREDADVDWRILTEALLALGDFYTLIEEPGRARIMYRDAWQLLTDDDTRTAIRGALLETPVPLLQPEPDLTVALPFDEQGNPTAAGWETGYIVTQFTVTRRGRLADIGLLEMSPERNEAIEAEVKLALSRHVFRPRFESGFVADSPGQTLRFEFPYPKNAE